MVEQSPPRQAVSVRAVVLGLAGVVLICLLAPFNDHTLANTPLVGNYLPVAVLLLMFVGVLVNGVLLRRTPRHALTSPELAVVMAVMLVGCAVPTSGLHRYFLPSLVMPQAIARQSPAFAEALRSLNLPEWIHPSFSSTDRSTWPIDPVVTGYETRWTADTPVPYGAFLRPLATWGVFFGCFAGAILAMTLVVRRQWVSNERLPFPVAQVQLALLSPPSPGRFLNDTLGSRAFWVAFGAVFVLHLWNGLSAYTRAKVPGIPLDFDLRSLAGSPPFSYAEPTLYKAKLYLTAAAVTFLLRPQVSLSLWLFFVIQQGLRMWRGGVMGDPTLIGLADVLVGAFVAFTSIAVYVGRRHYLAVLRDAAGLGDGGSGAKGAGRWLIACLAAMAVWLWLAGCTALGAVTIVAVLFMLAFGIARIVAETGVIHYQFQWPVSRPFTLPLQMDWGRWSAGTPETFYHAQTLQTIVFDGREALPVFASHAVKLHDETAPGASRARLVVALLAALAVAYLAGGYAHLRNEYAHASTLDGANTVPIDPWGGRNNVDQIFAQRVVNYNAGGLPVPHNPLLYTGVGAALCSALYAGRLYFPAFPLHPVGLLMVGSYPMSVLWLSFLAGWLAKVLVAGLTGPEGLARARPVIIGIVLGESVSAAAWTLTGLLAHASALPYTPIRVLPP